MTKIIRLIWRLDFEPSYSFLDNRGKALKALRSTDEKLFAQVSDGTVVNSFAGQTQNDLGSHTMSIEATAISGSIEWNNGIDLGLMSRSDTFRGMDRTLSELIPIYELRAVRRAGIRFIGVAGRKSDATTKDRYQELLSNKVLDDAAQHLGDLKDVGLVLEGRSEDGISYRANYGPFALKNVNMFLSAPTSGDREVFYRHFSKFFDVDFYEINTAFLSGSLYRWARTKIDKMASFSESITKDRRGY